MLLFFAISEFIEKNKSMIVITLNIPKYFAIFGVVKIQIIVEDQFQDLFKITGNQKKLEVGCILIAEPFLKGEYFSRSVIFMVEYDKKGSIGFVLNKPMKFTTSDLVTELVGMKLPVYTGGPVEINQLYYFHRHPELDGALYIANGIYWGGNFEMLTSMLKAGKILPNEIRFFAGYSGWEAKQLESELKEDSWIIGNIDNKRFFDYPHEKLWETSMSELGGCCRILANFPQDPILN